MAKRLRAHIQKNVVGYIALMVAVAGVPSAYAIGANTVGSSQLKRGAVRGPDLANNAVTSAKVQNGSLLGADFAPGQLPPGPQGATGPPGAPGATKVQVRGSSGNEASCVGSERAVGGGGEAAGNDFIWASYPLVNASDIPVAWEVQADDPAGGAEDGVEATWVVCASP